MPLEEQDMILKWFSVAEALAWLQRRLGELADGG
jgi:hypothetical protein